MQQLSQHRARDQFQFPACVHAEAGGAYSWKELTIKPGGSGYDIAPGGMTGEPGRNPAYEVSGHRPKVPFVALLRRRLGDSPSGQVFEFERLATAPPAVDCIGTLSPGRIAAELALVTKICREGVPAGVISGSFGGGGPGVASPGTPVQVTMERRVVTVAGAGLGDPVCEENPTGCCTDEPVGIPLPGCCAGLWQIEDIKTPPVLWMLWERIAGTGWSFFDGVRFKLVLWENYGPSGPNNPFPYRVLNWPINRAALPQFRYSNSPVWTLALGGSTTFGCRDYGGGDFALDQHIYQLNPYGEGITWNAYAEFNPSDPAADLEFCDDLSYVTFIDLPVQPTQPNRPDVLLRNW